MRSRCAISAVGFLCLCLVVCESLETISPSAFDGYPDEPCTINMTIRNFRLILSWELENKSSPPANFTLWYTVMSKNEDLMKVKNCSDTTKSSCDVTAEWLEGMESYVAIVLVHRGDLTVCRCSDYIVPANAPLKPPEFEIIGFTDHINVTMEFPPVTSKIIREKMRSTPFVIKEQIGDSIRKQHKPKVNNVTGNFTFVLKDLLPKTNYCVSVYFDDDPAIKSPLKCIVLQPDQESGLSESAKVGIITSGLIVMFFVSTIIMLKRIGYICLKDNLPNVLNFHHFLTWIFPERSPSEAIDRLEIIPTNKKKRLWNYDYEDGSDSDEEVPTASVTGYTMHGLTGKPLPQSSDTSASPEDPLHEEDSGAEESDEAGVGAGAEPQLLTEAGVGPSEDPSGPSERRKSVLKDSFPSEDNSSMDEPGDNTIFNVNLNSVFLRVLHDKDASETLSLAEDAILLDEGPHRTESDLRIAGEDRTQPSLPSLPSQDLWTEDGSSEKSDTSDSDADVGDGYIMR
ncbi:interferon alpha/beta receptor 2 isoform X1 [Mus pahari]|uniref:interferon alpha/beta receptor 2 isoform X1 n=1 Tax=Mus pahari TaxID=10093 RepID=UPI000A30E24B|nr:interferon alpha/beta receptor 2 isoform X1 [Mus pahari]XP_029400583.1 interferon alpha/beta receptor 2 isoform X1 [Mus pahari]XP_029400584.1 interferon alpha/beta receptor 2 isoform X1 [Mus pahari]